MRTVKKFYRPWLVKLCLFLLFLNNLGVPWLIGKVAEIRKDNPENKLSETEIRERRDILDRFIIEKTKEAEEAAKNGTIDPKIHYFDAMKELLIKEKELSVFANVNTVVGGLYGIIHREKSFAEIVRAAEEFHRWQDDNNMHSYGYSKEPLNLTWGKFGWWLFWFYLNNLPLAAILFLMWAKQWGKELKLSRKINSFHFPLVVLSYPYIVTMVFRKWLKSTELSFMAEAELRRTKENLFVFLTKEEKEKIKEFTESSASMASCKERLGLVGLRPRHSLTMAIAATLVMMLVSGIARESNTNPKPPHQMVLAQQQESNQDRDGPEDQTPDNQPKAIVSRVMDLIPPDSDKFQVPKTTARAKRTCKEIDHVPRFRLIA